VARKTWFGPASAMGYITIFTCPSHKLTLAFYVDSVQFAASTSKVTLSSQINIYPINVPRELNEKAASLYPIDVGVSPVSCSSSIYQPSKLTIRLLVGRNIQVPANCLCQSNVWDILAPSSPTHIAISRIIGWK
jgi:hypothetical protein